MKRAGNFERCPRTIIAIDPGERSGFAILDPSGMWVAWGCSTDSRNSRDPIVRSAGDCVAVVETWTLQGPWNRSAVLGLAESAGRWIDTFREFGIEVVRVLPQSWKGSVLAGNPVGRKRGDAKRLSRERASRAVGRPVEDDNAADAICIALWAQHAREVAELVA